MCAASVLFNLLILSTGDSINLELSAMLFRSFRSLAIAAAVVSAAAEQAQVPLVAPLTPPKTHNIAIIGTFASVDLDCLQTLTYLKVLALAVRRWPIIYGSLRTRMTLM